MISNTTFFSYSRKDSEFVLRLAKDLRERGAQLWLDQLDIKPGNHWDTAIEAALTSASRMIVILSPASVGSNNVMDEVSFALENGKIVIPVLLTECTPPFRLKRLQRINFTNDYQMGLDQLFEVLGDSIDNKVHAENVKRELVSAQPSVIKNNSVTLLKKLEVLTKLEGSIVFEIGAFFVQFARDKNDKEIIFEAVSHNYLDILSKKISNGFSEMGFKIEDGNYFKYVDIKKVETIIPEVEKIFEEIYKVNYDKDFNIIDNIEY